MPGHGRRYAPAASVARRTAQSGTRLRQQTLVVVHAERRRERVDEPGLTRDAVPAFAYVRCDRAGEVRVLGLGREQAAEAVEALLPDLLQEREHVSRRQRIHGLGVGRVVRHGIDLTVGGQTSTAGQGNQPNTRRDSVDGLLGDLCATVLPQAREPDLLRDDVLPACRPGRNADQISARYIAYQPVFPRVEAGQDCGAVSPPWWRQTQIRTGAPAGDGHGRSFSVPLPETVGLRDALCLLDGVDDLMGEDVQPALTAARTPGRHEHAVPGRGSRVAPGTEQRIGPRADVQANPAQVNGEKPFQDAPHPGVQRRSGITEMNRSRSCHRRSPHGNSPRPPPGTITAAPPIRRLALQRQTLASA